VDGLDFGGEDLEGLGYDIIGVTGAYVALEPLEGDEARVAPMTVNVDAFDEAPKEPEAAKGKGRRKRGAEAQPAQEAPPATGDAPQQLVDLYQLLGQLTKNLAQQYRSLRLASRELGRLSRGLRNVEDGVVFGVGTFGATRAAAEQLQQVAGIGQAPGVLGGPGAQQIVPPVMGEATHPSQSSRQQPPPVDQQPSSEIDREPDGPATGSLNAADLLSPDLFKNSAPPEGDTSGS
jgi:hypothetical protein